MRVGIAQMDIKIKEKSVNLEKCEYFMSQAKKNSVDLLVFPECALMGYIYDSFEEAFAQAEAIPGNLTNDLTELCKKYQITAVFGLIEKENQLIYNTALLIDPEGIIGKYRKTHLLHLGLDRFCTPGSEFIIYNLPQARIAPLICYELRSPEPSRIAALNGAQLILSPTNLAKGTEVYSSFINQTRACENRVFLASANRVGEERGFKFIGNSQIINNLGQVLAQGSGDKEELIYADISPEEADIKDIVVIPDEYEFSIFADRKPAMYGALVK